MKSRQQLEMENYELKQQIKQLKTDIKEVEIRSKIEANNKVLAYSSKFEEISTDMKKLKEEITKKNNKIKRDATAYNVLSTRCSKLQSDLNVFKKENGRLNKILDTKNAQINEHKAKALKDSSNSSKPPSSNGLKYTQCNSRTKTSRYQGGQLGHKFHPIQIPESTKIIKMPKSQKCSCGGHIEYDDSNIDKRFLIKINISYEVIEHQGINGSCRACGMNIVPKFPKGIDSKVAYDSSVKALAVLLTEYLNVPVRKVKAFIGSITRTNGPSIGSIDSWKKEAYKLAEPVCKRFKKAILKEKVIYSDETPMNIKGNKYNYAIGAFTKDISVIEVYKNRSNESFRKMGILPNFFNILMGDHLKSLYNLGPYQKAECNAHIDRKLKWLIEVFERKAVLKFREFLYKVKAEVDSSKKGKLSKKRYRDVTEEWQKLLKEWNEEFELETKNKNLKYYVEERRLLKQLKEYMQNHLMFAKHAEVEFTNNIAERGLRPLKSKLKTAGQFRNIEYANGHANIVSVLDTSRKQTQNMLDNLVNLICGKKILIDI